MYSYALLSINLFYSKKYHLSKAFILIEIICQWILAFTIPLFFDSIDFYYQGKFCYINKIFLMIINLFTSLFLPILLILIFNLIIYLTVYKLERNINHRLSSRRQNGKYIRVFRQTIGFFSVFFFGWGIFILLLIIDKNHLISENIYIIILSFPSISLLIFTLLIKYWNKPSKKSFLKSKIRHSLSATTVRFSQPLNINFIQ